MMERYIRTPLAITASLALLAASCAVDGGGLSVEGELSTAGEGPDGSSILADAAPVSELRPSSLGRCYRRSNTDTHTDPMHLVERLELTDGWLRLNGAPELDERNIEDTYFGLGEGELLSGTSEDRIWGPTVAMRRVVDAIELGAEVVVGLRNFDSETYAGDIVAVYGDEIAFVGDCEEPVTALLVSFAEGRGLTPRQAVDGLVDGSLGHRDLLAWLEQEEATPAWGDLPPDERFLDPVEPNDAVTGPTRLVVLFVDIGAPEVQRGTLLCASSTVAQSGCYDLGAGIGDMVIRVVEDVPLTLTLVEEDERGELGEPMWVAEVDADVLRDLDDASALMVEGLTDPAAQRGEGVEVSVISSEELDERIDAALDAGVIERS